MAVWIVGNDEHAALADSVTETAFGPLFYGTDEASDFLDWLHENYKLDPRRLGDEQLQNLQLEFRKHEEERDTLPPSEEVTEVES